MMVLDINPYMWPNSGISMEYADQDYCIILSEWTSTHTSRINGSLLSFTGRLCGESGARIGETSERRGRAASADPYARGGGAETNTRRERKI